MSTQLVPRVPCVPAATVPREYSERLRVPSLEAFVSITPPQCTPSEYPTEYPTEYSLEYPTEYSSEYPSEYRRD